MRINFDINCDNCIQLQKEVRFLLLKENIFI